MASKKSFKLDIEYNYQLKLNNWRNFATRNKVPFDCEKCHKTHAHKTILLNDGMHICWYCWIHKESKFIAIQKPAEIVHSEDKQKIMNIKPKAKKVVQKTTKKQPPLKAETKPKTILKNISNQINNTPVQDAQKILTVENLNKFFVKSGKLVQVLNDIDFTINEKDFFGIIGESGSGKSTTGKCIIKLYSSSSGIITFDNKIINAPVLKMGQKVSYLFDKLASPSDPISAILRKREFRSTIKNREDKKSKNWLYNNMSMIFQDPMSSLNPRKNVLELVSEPLVINKTITNDIDKLLGLYAQTNSYFQSVYKIQDFDLTKKYLIPFYQKNIKLFKNKLEEIKALLLETDKINDLLSIISELEISYKNSLNEFNDFVLNIKNLIYKNNKKLVSGKVHPTEIKYYDAEMKLELEKKYLKLPKQYWELKDILKREQNRLDEYIKRQKAIYELQNLPRFNSILNSLKSEIKSMQQDAKLTSSITDHLFKQTDIFIKQDTYKALKEVTQTYGAGANAYFDIEKMNEFYEFISNKIKSKYADLTKDTSKLVALSNKLDTLSINETGQQLITSILDEYKALYEQVKKELKVLKTTNFIEADLEVKAAINKMVESSFEIKLSITNEIQHIQKTIFGTVEAMNKCRTEYAKNKLESSASYEKALKDFIIAKLNRKNFTKEYNVLFKNDKLTSINNQKTYVKELSEELFNLNKKFNLVVNTKLNNYIRLIKENPNNTSQNIFKEKLEHWLKAFSKDEKAKHGAIDILKRNIKNSLMSLTTINFEITNNWETINLCRRLRTNNKALLQLQRKPLRNLITRDYVYNALDEVGLKNEHAYRYPHEFSGGQRQRIVIARALISKPKLIIADEPISALDVSIQAQVVNIMKNLAKKHGITFIFIAHDLSMVRYASNRLIIMHKGKIVEKGDTNEVFNHPIHPYTKSLIKASPELSKIHVDLASFSSKLDYDKNYSINNCPEFYSVSDKFEHFVYATREQMNKWKK